MSNDQTYQGEQDQATATTDYNSLAFHIQQQIAQISTAKIVKVIKRPYDKDGNQITRGARVPVGYVDVQPLVNQIDGRDKATPHGTIHRLSYYRYAGGDTALIIDPKVDDIGLMVVSDRDTSSVRATNKQANPGSRRKFDPADGTYFGITQGPDAPKQWLAATDDGLEIEDRHGNKIITGSAGIRIEDNSGNKIVMSSTGIDFNP